MNKKKDVQTIFLMWFLTKESQDDTNLPVNWKIYGRNYLFMNFVNTLMGLNDR